VEAESEERLAVRQRVRHAKALSQLVKSQAGAAEGSETCDTHGGSQPRQTHPTSPLPTLSAQVGRQAVLVVTPQPPRNVL
jgi:hypothetical protein